MELSFPSRSIAALPAGKTCPAAPESSTQLQPHRHQRSRPARRYYPPAH